MDNSLKDILKRLYENTASIEELRFLSNLLDTDEGKRILSEQMDEELALIERNAHATENEKELTQIYNKIRIKITRHHYKHLVWRVASIAIPFILIGYLLSYIIPLEIQDTHKCYNEIVAENGMCTQVVLQDGSQVWLNRGSVLKFPDKFSNNERRVKINGEGYFIVNKENERPFLVESSQGIVTVTGTTFNFNSYDDANSIIVTLYEGKVMFTQGDQAFNLMPGQQLTYNKEKSEIVVDCPKNINENVSWRTGALSFNRTSLQDVIFKLNKWYNVDFCVRDQDAWKYSFTYSTQGTDLPELLKELEMISPLTFKEEGGKINIYVKK